MASVSEVSIAAWVGRLGVLLMAAITIWCVSTIQQLTLDIARMTAHLEAVDSRPIPPPWVANRLDDLRNGQNSLRERIERIETRVTGRLNGSNGNMPDKDLLSWSTDK